MQREPDDDSAAISSDAHGGREYVIPGRPRPPVRVRKRVIEYGPHIPTLVRLLEEGYFEQSDMEGESG